MCVGYGKKHAFRLTDWIQTNMDPRTASWFTLFIGFQMVVDETAKKPTLQPNMLTTVQTETSRNLLGTVSMFRWHCVRIGLYWIPNSLAQDCGWKSQPRGDALEIKSRCNTGSPRLFPFVSTSHLAKLRIPCSTCQSKYGLSLIHI